MLSMYPSKVSWVPSPHGHAEPVLSQRSADVAPPLPGFPSPAARAGYPFDSGIN